ncbi:MAG TPA: anti-sigma factor, partial [Acetobacteraceae bacterium]
SSPALRVAALIWQERFVSITELQQSEAPDPNVWKRIEIQLAAEDQVARARPAPPETGLLRQLQRWWLASTAAAALAAVAAVVVALQFRGEVQDQRMQLASLRSQGQQLAGQNAQLLAQLRTQPQVRYVSILTDERSNPAMLVTFDPARSTLTVKRGGNYQEGPQASLQLWGLPAAGAPRSLGVLQADVVQRLPLPQQALQMPALAISLEPRGGVSGERGPTGPVLWKGPVVQAPL